MKFRECGEKGGRPPYFASSITSYKEL